MAEGGRVAGGVSGGEEVMPCICGHYIEEHEDGECLMCDECEGYDNPEEESDPFGYEGMEDESTVD